MSIVVIDPTEFEIMVDVPSYERNRIKPDQSALVFPGASSSEEMARRNIGETDSLVTTLGQNRVEGTVYSVNPAVNPGWRSVRVIIRTTANGDQLEDGEFVSVWIATEQRNDVVVVPMNVMVYRDNKPYVYVIDAMTNRAQMRAVVPGLQGLGEQQILEGIEVGDILVTDGRFQLSNNATTRTIAGTEPMNEPMNEPTTGGQDD